MLSKAGVLNWIIIKNIAVYWPICVPWHNWTEHVRPHLISVMSYHGLRICNDNVKFFFLFPVVLLHILLSVLDEFLSSYYFRNLLGWLLLPKPTFWYLFSTLDMILKFLMNMRRNRSFCSESKNTTFSDFWFFKIRGVVFFLLFLCLF